MLKGLSNNKNDLEEKEEKIQPQPKKIFIV